MKNNFLNFFNLHNGEEDRQKVVEDISTTIVFKGSNLWILTSAIVIASIGLNVNSTAVIIGAMLISPLMGPIVGAGFALGTYNFLLLKKSFKALLIATIVSLIASTIYFFISPFKEPQNELLARTSPNIYDVLIAFFGGIVGAIAITRKEKGNPIAGVAIATALMPPLCTAGFGLAIGNFKYFLGAFYLYTINCFFICIATFFIIKYLGYEPIQEVDKKYAKKIRRGITTLVIILILPSFYLAYNLLNEKKFSQKVNIFLQQEFTLNGYPIIYKHTNYQSNPKQIIIAILGKKLTPAEVENINRKLPKFELDNTILEIKQDPTDIKTEIRNELSHQDKMLSEKDLQIQNLQQQLALYQNNYSTISQELLLLFPSIKTVALGTIHSNTDSTHSQLVMIYNSEPPLDSMVTNRIKAWLSKKLNAPDIRIIHSAKE